MPRARQGYLVITLGSLQDPYHGRIRVSPALVEDGAEGAHAQAEDAGVVKAAPLWAWGEGWVRVRVSTGFG